MQIEGSAPERTEAEVQALQDHIKSLIARLEAADRQAEQLHTDHQAELDRLQATHRAELERAHKELERARQDADQWREEAKRERQHSHALFERGMDLSNRVDLLHRERSAELKRPWWRRLFKR